MFNESVIFQLSDLGRGHLIVCSRSDWRKIIILHWAGHTCFLQGLVCLTDVCHPLLNISEQRTTIVLLDVQVMCAVVTVFFS